MHELVIEVRMYVSSVLGLLGGRRVYVPESSPRAPKKLPPKTDDARVDALLQFGRAELVAEHEGLERVRGRAQFMLTTGLGVLALGVGAIPLSAELFRGPLFPLWVVGLSILILGILGSASVVTAQKQMGVVTTRDIAAGNPGDGGLVLLHIDAIAISRDTRSAAITVFRDSVLLDLLGFALLSVAFLASFVGSLPKVGL